jgi:hypothetical protein
MTAAAAVAEEEAGQGGMESRGIGLTTTDEQRGVGGAWSLRREMDGQRCVCVRVVGASLVLAALPVPPSSSVGPLADEGTKMNTQRGKRPTERKAGGADSCLRLEDEGRGQLPASSVRCPTG